VTLHDLTNSEQTSAKILEHLLTNNTKGE
jgi:hypothetical protein